MQNLVDHGLQPIVGNYFRNSAQDYTVLDFLSARSQRQVEAAEHSAKRSALTMCRQLIRSLANINPPASTNANADRAENCRRQRKTYEVQEARKNSGNNWCAKLPWRTSSTRSSALSKAQHRRVGGERAH